MKYVYTATENGENTLDFLTKKLAGISMPILKKQLAIKEIKVNGKKITDNIVLKKGETVEIFLPERLMPKTLIPTIYKDDNIVVVDKPILFDTTENLLPLLKEEYGELYPIHRLDRNTSGLVIFAKNLVSKNILEKAFAEHLVEKFYEAYVFGKMEKQKDELTAYLKKDEEKRMSYISATPKAGYVKIQTQYVVESEMGDISKIKVKLVTGKMHQIRAHLAFIGHFIIGDNKYGDVAKNKNYKLKYQALKSTELVFLNLTGELSYLSGKKIETTGQNLVF